jgi:GMP synthase (glutamine-hydrolysing)
MRPRKTVLVVEHAPRRANGILRHLARSADLGLGCHLWRCYEDQSPPEIKFDGLVLSGGPMMVDELTRGIHQFYPAERALILAAEDAGVPVLGMCLGAQVLAQVFGGVVSPRKWAVGWHTVRPTAAAAGDELFSTIDSFMTFELHRDYVTTLPPEAIELATSDNSGNEAFRISKKSQVWGCVFHPEIDPDEADRIYQIDPQLFMSCGVQRFQLRPPDDGGNSRRKLFSNFAQLVVGK